MKALSLFSLMVVALAACGGSRLAPRVEAPQDPEPVVVPEPAPAPAQPTTDIVITTGVHGNEPSGWLVQDQLFALGFNVFGPCNPWGIQNNKRELEDGTDLNRAFAWEGYAEVDAVKKFLEENPPGLLLDLHEDPNGTGAYLIQNGPDDDIARAIIDALKDEFEFDPEPRSVITGENGLVKPTLQQLRGLLFLKVYGLAVYAWANYACTAIVVECPGAWPEDKRKRYQLRVCEVAREIYAARR
ncbi:MAG: succinylglutamate desuccinylase/aspartoacylase family protein [Planctomycetes bacterium]|nr:succinylglutamate desuccinylase/aspartoacylase family protein [Planctomycetota bacterium]